MAAARERSEPKDLSESILNIKHRDIFDHLPPLSAPQPAYSERPKIVEYGAYTQASPTKEKSHYRHTSDAVANNYTPSAQSLTTKLIYKRQGKTSSSAKKKNSPRKQPSPPGKVLEEKIQPLYSGQSQSPSSVYSKGKGNLVTQGVPRVGVIKGHTSPPLVGLPKKWSPQNEQDTSEAERKIDIDTSPLSSSKPPRVKRPQSAEQFVKSNGRSPSPQGSGLHHYGEPMPESPDSKKAKVAWGGQGRVTESSRNETIDTETISNGHTDMEIHDIGGSYTVTSSPLNISSVLSFREHDEETLSVLNISFPPSTTPTFGLSRAVSPPESELERYSSLVEKAIMSNMLAPLSKEWKRKTHDFLPKSLKQDFKETLDELDKEMEAEYARSVKQSILDYVLLDPAEQRRLGLHMPLPVIYPAGRERFPWHASVIACREYLEKNLFVTHVVLRELLFLWESQ